MCSYEFMSMFMYMLVKHVKQLQLLLHCLIPPLAGWVSRRSTATTGPEMDSVQACM